MRISVVIYFIIILTVTGMFFSYSRNKLTLPASISGGLIAILVYFGAGITGFCMMAAFFTMAILATAYKRREKKRSATDHPEKRNTRQVWANGGVAGLAGAMSFFTDNKLIFPLVIGCVFSSAAADTISSELGMVKGKKFFNILNFQPDQKGLDGVISMEGCLWGLAASMVIAVIYYLGHLSPSLSPSLSLSLSPSHFLIIVLAGTIGNLSDSLMGALWERKGWIGNDAVNLMNTLIAAMVGLALFLCF